jgi:hypothetical protein
VFGRVNNALARSVFDGEIEGRDDEDPLNISGQSQRRICEISQF